MSNDERIARLTDLARRVWPTACAYATEHGVQVLSGLSSEGTGRLRLFIEHPRAPDASEAALLVLAGENTP